MAAKLGTANGSADPSTTAELGARGALQLASFCGGCQQTPSCDAVGGEWGDGQSGAKHDGMV